MNLARVVVALLLVSVASAGEAAPSRLALPEAGAPAHHRLAPGDRHRFTACVAAGEFLHVVFDQRRLDVAVEVYDPTGAPLPRLDTITFSAVPEDVPILAQEPGCFRLEVYPETAGAGGRYGVAVAARRPATDADLAFTAAVYNFQRATGYQRGGEWIPAFAVEQKAGALTRAARGFAGYGATWREAEARRQLSRACRDLERGRCARDEAEAAVALFTATRQDSDLARALKDRAVARSLFACDVDGAWRDHQTALALLAERGEGKAVALTRRDLAILARRAGRLQEGLDLFGRALEEGRSAKLSDRQQAITYQELGETYILLGDPERAEASFETAGRLAGGQASDTVRLERQGWLLHLRGQHEAAGRLFAQAIRAAEREERERGMAASTAWNSLGINLLAQGDHEGARRALGKALEPFEKHPETSSPLGRGTVLANLGKVELAAGNARAALGWYEKALGELEQCSRTLKAVEVQAGIARSSAALGDLGAAREHAETAVARVETLRAAPRSLRFRRDFLRELRTVYEAAIDVYLQSSEVEREPGWSARAFELFERIQDRSLLDLLAAGRLGVDPGRRSLTAEIKRAYLQSQQLEGAGEDASAARRSLEHLLWDLDDRTVLAADAAEGQPRSAREIRGRLPADVTLVSVYAGERRGALWLLDRQHGLTVHRLPPKDALLAAVTTLRRFVREEPRSLIDRQAARVADMLFPAGAMDRLRGRRLRIVSDEELDVLPFALLRVPAAGGGDRGGDRGGHRYLAASSLEISIVPSASSMLLLDERPRLLAGGRAVVLADPAVGSGSGAASGEGTLLRSALAAADLDVLEALPGTVREAERIRELLGGDAVEIRLRQQATRAAVLGGALRRAPLVHFATHALLAEDPELAGLVLSPRPAEGDDGFLQAYEIAGLELSAELVVLSACETGGRGLYGLPEAFLTAGARGVVVSLWKVGDEATTHLMGIFYQHLAQGRPVAAALQAAQQEMAADDRFAPKDWAGFTLLGDPAAAPFAARKR